MISVMGHDNRQPEYEILPHILERWSPRSMTGDPILREDLFSIFEAARFAPSAFNEQPWRFVYALRGTPEFDSFKNVLVEFNWNWAQKASALVLLLGKAKFTKTGESNTVGMFDCGCAWGYLALEATRRGYVTHGMSGFNRDSVQSAFNVPSGYFPIAIIAVGKIAPRDFLPTELAEKEYPSSRKQQHEFVFEGKFRTPEE